MSKASNRFRIVTRWKFNATIEEIASILNDAPALPEWWGDVYISTKIVEPGGANGMGRRVAVHSKGWLPYELKWMATLVDSHAPHTWTISASGDLEGQGVWTLRQNGPVAEVEYDWRVNAEKPILKLLSPLLAPIFAWNHRWAMARGEEGLRREIAHRRLESTG